MFTQKAKIRGERESNNDSVYKCLHISTNQKRVQKEIRNFILSIIEAIYPYRVIVVLGRGTSSRGSLFPSWQGGRGRPFICLPYALPSLEVEEVERHQHLRKGSLKH